MGAIARAGDARRSPPPPGSPAPATAASVPGRAGPSPDESTATVPSRARAGGSLTVARRAHRPHAGRCAGPRGARRATRQRLNDLCGRQPGVARRLISRDGFVVFERQPDLVEPLHQPPPCEVVDRERLVDPGRADGPCVQIDDDPGRRVVEDRVHERAHRLVRELDREQADLQRVVPEDVGEARSDHRAEPVVLDRPHGVLAAGPGPEVGPGEEDRRPRVALVVEDERRVLAPFVEQEGPEPRSLDPLEVLRRDDLVGVDIGAVQRERRALDPGDGLHHQRSSGRVKWPAIAVAAATRGLTRWVLPPLPWRPSKLRLLVEALRFPGPRMSGFMPRHIEQPAPRHSKPAAWKTSCRPSPSACSLTATLPGTTRPQSPSFTFRPRTTSAAARRSSIRELVHEPMKIVSGRMSRIGVPASKAMYVSARSSSGLDGTGTEPSIVVDCAGFVPQLT